MKLLLFLSILFLTATCFSASDTGNNATVIDLGYAQYRGNQSNAHTVAFLGLPYAEPPLGNLRWRAPLPLNTSRVKDQAAGQIVDATSYPEPCIQGGTGCAYSLPPLLPDAHQRALVQLVKPGAQVLKTASRSMSGCHSARRRVTIVCHPAFCTFLHKLTRSLSQFRCSFIFMEEVRSNWPVPR